MNSNPTDKTSEQTETKSVQSLLKGEDRFVLKNVPHTVTNKSIAATLRSVPGEVTPTGRPPYSLLSEVLSIGRRSRTNTGG